MAGPSPRVSGLNLLYRGSCLVGRWRHRGQAVRALVSYLSGHGREGDGLLRSHAAAIVGGPGVIVVPRQLFAWFDAVEPVLRRHGWRFVDSPWTVLDPVSGQVVLEPPLLEPENASDGEDGSAPSPSVPAGSYPIRRWVLAAGSAGPGSVHRAQAVAAVLETVSTEWLGPSGTLAAVARVMAGTEPTAMVLRDRAQVAADVASLIEELDA